MSDRLNPMQTALAAGYDDGRFRDVTDYGDLLAELVSCGDGLFAYLIVELSDEEGCNDAGEAVRRLTRIRHHVDAALAIMQTVGEKARRLDS